MKVQNSKEGLSLLNASLLSLALLCSFPALAQKKGKNLIPNPSFEKHKNKSNDIANAEPWIGIGTVDYYIKPDKRDTSRFKGARTGTAYAGLRFQSDYKEYMYVKLKEKLVRDQLYHFQMFVRLLESESVTVTVKQLGAYFSEEAFYIGMNFLEGGLVDSTYDKGIAGTTNWITIQGYYTARGGEEYIIIGNFRSKMKDDFVKKKKLSLFEFKEAYYYIDDVSLRKIIQPKDSTEMISDQVFPETVKAGDKIVVEQVFFEPGSDAILNKSYNALRNLTNFLNDHPFMELEIHGHANNSANESQNRKLSKERAKAVCNYLKEEGVINPLSYKGYGSGKPLAPNDTEENKAKNRRIEILIIKE